MKEKQITITVSEDNFPNTIAEIKSALDYEGIEYNYTIKDVEPEKDEEVIETIEDLAHELTKENLIEFLIAYNNYVVTFYETHDKESEPVCMLEYFNNDYGV